MLGRWRSAMGTAFQAGVAKWNVDCVRARLKAFDGTAKHEIRDGEKN
jgi:hypothetical protein